MGTIILGIKPEQIDPVIWKMTFYDAMKISQKGELSRSVRKIKDGIMYWCNQLAVPSYTENIGNVWVSNGDLVQGIAIDTFELVDKIAYYLGQLKEADLKDLEVGTRNKDGFLIIWYGDTNRERVHLWMLAIACLLYSRFSEAVYIDGTITPLDCIRASGIAGDVLGRPVAIPKKYIGGNVTEAVSELIDGMDERRYNCSVAEDLYYWDNEGDAVDPKLDQAMLHYMKQIDAFGKKHADKIRGMTSIQKFSYFREIVEKEIPDGPPAYGGKTGITLLLPEHVWDKILDSQLDEQILRPYLGLFSVDTQEMSARQLVNLLAVNGKLFMYYWQKYLDNR